MGCSNVSNVKWSKSRLHYFNHCCDVYCRLMFYCLFSILGRMWYNFFTRCLLHRTVFLSTTPFSDGFCHCRQGWWRDRCTQFHIILRFITCDGSSATRKPSTRGINCDRSIGHYCSEYQRTQERSVHISTYACAYCWNIIWKKINVCTQLRLGIYDCKTQLKSVKLVSDGTSRPLLVTSLMASLFYRSSVITVTLPITIELG